MNTNVVHDIENHRYEIFLDDERVGLMDYELRPGEIHLVHTEVDPAQQGKNLAGILMREALDDVRERGLKMRPVCSYVVKFVERFDEYADLVG